MQLQGAERQSLVVKGEDDTDWHGAVEGGSYSELRL